MKYILDFAFFVIIFQKEDLVTSSVVLLTVLSSERNSLLMDPFEKRRKQHKKTISLFLKRKFRDSFKAKDCFSMYLSFSLINMCSLALFFIDTCRKRNKFEVQFARIIFFPFSESFPQSSSRRFQKKMGQSITSEY